VKEKVRFFKRRFLNEEAGAIPFGYPSTLAKNLFGEWSNMQTAAPTATTLTPAALGATTGRVFPFVMTQGMNVAKIYMLTPLAVATCLQIGIFDAMKTPAVHSSGALSTTVGTTTYSPTAFPLGSGMFFYFCVTNNNSADATGVYNITQPFTTAAFALWGSFVVTAGAMPTTLGTITKTVGGFHCYTVLGTF
jgi:hypothetical protein